jgi:hypothetical protein
VVLLVDRGVAASQRALATYSALHRLLLALAEHYSLWELVAARLDAFVARKAAVGGSCLSCHLAWVVARRPVMCVSLTWRETLGSAAAATACNHAPGLLSYPPTQAPCSACWPTPLPWLPRVPLPYPKLSPPCPDTPLAAPLPLPQRTKEACPNLGWLIPLLGLSPRHSWRAFAPLLIDESFDRNVLWICKHDPSLVEEFKKPMAKVGRCCCSNLQHRDRVAQTTCAAVPGVALHHCAPSCSLTAMESRAIAVGLCTVPAVRWPWRHDLAAGLSRGCPCGATAVRTSDPTAVGPRKQHYLCTE